MKKLNLKMRAFISVMVIMLSAYQSYGQTFTNNNTGNGDFLHTTSTVTGVGIGVFSSNLSSALHVNTNLTATNSGFNTGEVFRTDGPAVSSYWRMYSNTTERLRLEWDNTNAVSLFQSVNAPLSIRALANQPITFYTGATNTEKVRITNAGEVGIGTAYPESTLDVNGSIQAKEIVVISATGKQDLLAMITQLQSEVAQLKQQIHALANH